MLVPTWSAGCHENQNSIRLYEAIFSKLMVENLPGPQKLPFLLFIIYLGGGASYPVTNLMYLKMYSQWCNSDNMVLSLFLIVPVFWFQSPHVLVRQFGIIYAHLLQYLLQVALKGDGGSEREEGGGGREEGREGERRGEGGREKRGGREREEGEKRGGREREEGREGGREKRGGRDRAGCDTG